MKPTIHLVCGLAALAVAGSASAHHAFNMYRNDQYVTINGVVKSWVWKNPHAMMDVVAMMPDGKTETWSVECSSPNIIGRKGWTMDSVKVGDKMPITLHPMKDGSKYGLMVAMTTPRGETLKDKD